MAEDPNHDEAISNALLNPEGTKAQIESAANAAGSAVEGTFKVLPH